MHTLVQIGLYFSATTLFLLGVILIYKSFADKISEKKHKEKIKLVKVGTLGVLLLFISSIIIIYCYTLHPISKRIIKELQKKSYLTVFLEPEFA